MIILEVKNQNVRLDKYLAENTEHSRATINKMIDQGLILVNDVVKKASYLLKVDDKIAISDEPLTLKPIVGEDIKLDIVYEDDDILVINKPSGLVVHPGNGHQSKTLVNGLMNHTSFLSDLNGESRPGIVHRIDKDTSGLIIVAKNNKAHQILADDFKYHRLKRGYIALLTGEFPHESATIDAPIGRDKANRQKMTVTADNAKTALTNLKVITKYEDYTLVELVLATGRTHQIRVHMNYIGFPIYNDPVYNTKANDDFGQFLHSFQMDFIHPITKKAMHFECPLPKPFQQFIEKLEVKKS